jgi:hypothetical protein
MLCVCLYVCVTPTHIAKIIRATGVYVYSARDSGTGPQRHHRTHTHRRRGQEKRRRR